MNSSSNNEIAIGTKKGHLHPTTMVIKDITQVFTAMGFEIAEGPELETEHYNFDALNVPKDHPARDMQDTFWIKGLDSNGERKLLRTQTSPVQIRFMENTKPPLRIIVPGKVFRNEATDATHEAQFYQLEGLVVDKNISMAHLKGTITHFLQKLFGDDVIIRFRPSFFPFTEPSVEVDMKWKDKWLEVGGAGMVHPKVFESVGINPKEYTGFAFGFGIDRFVLLKYGVDDLRFLYSANLRLINQF